MRQTSIFTSILQIASFSLHREQNIELLTEVRKSTDSHILAMLLMIPGLAETVWINKNFTASWNDIRISCSVI